MIELISQIWNFLFWGCVGDANVFLAVDPITLVIVAYTIGKGIKTSSDIKKRDDLERKIEKLSADEKAILLEKVQKEKDAKARLQIVTNTIDQREQLDKEKEQYGIGIGLIGIFLAVFLITKIKK